MRKLLFIFALILIATTAQARPYKSGLFITKLKLNEDGTGVVLDLPFKVYGQNITMEGKDITYRLNDIKLDGREVLAKVDYCIEDMVGHDVKSEQEVAEKHAGYMGNDWSKLKVDVRYSKHYPVKKKDKLATYDELGNKTEYNGADKEEYAKFCLWEDTAIIVLNGELQ